MAQQSSTQKIGTGGRIIRIALYLLAFVVMTFFPSIQTFKSLIIEREWNYSALVYEIAKSGVRKRNEVTQRQILAPYHQPLSSDETSSPEEENGMKDLTTYSLSALWHPTGLKPIIVNIANATTWRYFVVKVRVVLSSPNVRYEIESKENAIQIQDMIENTIGGQDVEEVRLPQGKAKLKEEIRSRMNTILGGEKIVAVYFDEFFFQ